MSRILVELPEDQTESVTVAVIGDVIRVLSGALWLLHAGSYDQRFSAPAALSISFRLPRFL